MRSYVPRFSLKTFSNLKDALSMLGEKQAGMQPFAGGTDLMVALHAGTLKNGEFFNLWGFDELRGIDVQPGYIDIGALTTYSEIAKNKVLQIEFPMMCEAAAQTGALAIQNRGTLGGNIAHASPAADSPPALLCYDAQVELVSAKTARFVPYARFHCGYKESVKEPNEIIYKIRFPRKRFEMDNTIHFFRKVGTREAQAITKVGIAMLLSHHNGLVDHVRIAFSSVAPIPFRCLAAEKILLGQKLDPSLIQHAQRKIQSELAPIDDIRSTKIYRNTVAANLFKQGIDRFNICAKDM